MTPSKERIKEFINPEMHEWAYTKLLELAKVYHPIDTDGIDSIEYSETDVSCALLDCRGNYFLRLRVPVDDFINIEDTIREAEKLEEEKRRVKRLARVERASLARRDAELKERELLKILKERYENNEEE